MAIEQFVGNRYFLVHYITYGWDGLVKDGYAANRLNSAQNSTNQNLRGKVEANFNSTCK